MNKHILSLVALSALLTIVGCCRKGCKTECCPSEETSVMAQDIVAEEVALTDSEQEFMLVLEETSVEDVKKF